jgi:excisionase family DNA binding protein
MTIKTKSKRRRTGQLELDGSITREPQNIFSTPAAARYLGVSESTLRFWRTNGEGPQYFHAGDRLIRYRRVDCDAWIEARLSA